MTTLTDPPNSRNPISFDVPEGLLEEYNRQVGGLACEPDMFFIETFKFLQLTAECQRRTGVRCSPPRLIDEVWHCFLVYDTELYQRFCDEHCGGFVHHKVGDSVPWLDHLVPIVQELGIELYGEIWCHADRSKPSMAKCG